MKKLEFLNRNLSRTELCEIGKKCKTDKQWHGYTKVYYEIMKDFREKPINIFEIGVYFGASLKMWEEFFGNGKIFGIDNGKIIPNSNIEVGGSNEIPSSDDIKMLQYGEVDKSNNFNWIETNRIKCFMADQRNKSQLDIAFNYFKCDEFDFILDDGQHYQEHQQKSLGLLFKNIKSNGFYIIEDVVNYEGLLAGSYWGQRKKDASDSTDLLFESYIKTGKLNSIYLSKKECEYIENNTDDVFMYDCENRNNSPISGSSKLIIIKKK